MRFRTQLAAAAAVAMLVGLAACGDDDDETASSGTSTTTDTAGGAGPAAPPAGTSSSMITMTDNQFSPASLTVAPGTQVMVMNEGSALHDLKDEATKGKTFDSGDIGGGESGSITAPDKAGDYPYYCTYHFGMTASLKVQ